MTPLRLLVKIAALAALVLFAPAAMARHDAGAPQRDTAAAAPLPQARPALWKLADKDTTIYLFGTIHILPGGVDWFHGPLAYAFNHSDVLVTELPDMPPGEVLKAIARHGVLPAGESLREKLGADRRSLYEAALTALGQPPTMFDRSPPWVPAMTLPLLAIQKYGYASDHGVEAMLDARAKDRRIPRLGLETLDFQLGLFTGQSETQQMQFLDTVVKGLPEMKGLIEAMVTAWSAGDADRLAALLNADEDGPAFAEMMLYSRNRTWAQWIEARMDQPGTVFLAVGAGHLAGPRSVGDLLTRDGYRVSRVQ